LTVGYVGVVFQPDSPWHEILAVLFGVGVGLTLDEFALWLELKDVYWAQEGRKSIDAVVAAAALTGMVLVGFTAWADVAHRVEDEVFAAVGAAGILGVAFVIVAAVKEKFAMAIVGLFVPPVAIVGAVRLAKPTSLWARVFYRESKLARARARYPGRGPVPSAANE
jgi:hypothetical protein